MERCPADGGFVSRCDRRCGRWNVAPAWRPAPRRPRLDARTTTARQLFALAPPRPNTLDDHAHPAGVGHYIEPTGSEPVMRPERRTGGRSVASGVVAGRAARRALVGRRRGRLRPIRCRPVRKRDGRPRCRVACGGARALLPLGRRRARELVPRRRRRRARGGRRPARDRGAPSRGRVLGRPGHQLARVDRDRPCSVTARGSSRASCRPIATGSLAQTARATPASPTKRSMSDGRGAMHALAPGAAARPRPARPRSTRGRRARGARRARLRDAG